MFRILIIEDEEPATRRLIKLVKEIEPDASVVATLTSVAASKNWIRENENPDLIFSDIQLSDGASFEIFRDVDPGCPIVFVTAYDQYAIEAFKHNSIDYLLKPVKKEELAASFTKFKKLKQPSSSLLDIEKLAEVYAGNSVGYKKRFVVRYGEHLRTISVEEIAYFFTEDKVNFLATNEGRRFIIDFNLDNLETILDPSEFFRINRQYIISIHSITEMFSYSKSRVLVKLKPPTKQDTIVSTERSSAFKAWLGDENTPSK